MFRFIRSLTGSGRRRPFGSVRRRRAVSGWKPLKYGCSCPCREPRSPPPGKLLRGGATLQVESIESVNLEWQPEVDGLHAGRGR